ncbi:MAG TPA: hypothetical protein VLA92_01010 [Candidatus Saccharimonadales bacterium]|nr:hypothetical protein [Candidatus Saccharimonadales bacterium]
MSESHLILPKDTLEVIEGLHTVSVVFEDETVAVAWPTGEHPYNNLILGNIGDEAESVRAFEQSQVQLVARAVLRSFEETGDVPDWFIEADFKNGL